MKSYTIALGTAIVTLGSLDYFGGISKKYCSVTCLHNYDGIGFNWFFLFLICFSLSVIASLISEKSYSAWWRFARIAFPIILLFSTIINLRLHHTNYGPFNMDNMFDLPALVVMYAVFVFGSLIQIWRGYK